VKRRKFISNTAFGLLGASIPYTELPFSNKNKAESKNQLTFGIVADVHHGMIPDALDRLEVFIEKSQERNVDFIIQLGDFCHGTSNSKDFLSVWRSFKNPKYHVLGNHDMDLTSKEVVMDFWGMEEAYYSFTEKGIRFIIMDANFLYQEGKYIDYNKANFYVPDNMRTYIHPDQISWLEQTLQASSEPCIVVSHQSLWHYQYGVKNRLEIQQILENHQDKIICCLNGHNHIDYHHKQNGIDYLEINSMSYQWLGDKYSAKRYSTEQHKLYQHLHKVAPYEDPLYAFATIDLHGSMKIEGVRSQWLSPSPKELGVPDQVLGSQYSASISDREVLYSN